MKGRIDKARNDSLFLTRIAEICCTVTDTQACAFFYEAFVVFGSQKTSSFHHFLCFLVEFFNAPCLCTAIFSHHAFLSIFVTTQCLSFWKIYKGQHKAKGQTQLSHFHSFL